MMYGLNNGELVFYLALVGLFALGYIGGRIR